MDEDIQYAEPFREGVQAARIGQRLSANPYLRIVAAEFYAQAWADGFGSVDTTILSQKERATIYFEGWSAGAVKMEARACPYLSDEYPEKAELWMLGYGAS